MKLYVIKGENILKKFEDLDITQDKTYLVSDDGYVFEENNGIPIIKIKEEEVKDLRYFLNKNFIAFYKFLYNQELCSLSFYTTTDAKLLIYAFLVLSQNRVFSIKDLAHHLSIEWKEAMRIVEDLQNKGIVQRYYSTKKVTDIGLKLMKQELSQFYNTA